MLYSRALFLGSCLFLPSLSYGQSSDCTGLICTEFADPNYYLRQASHPDVPLYDVRVAVSKTPYLIADPTVNADDVTLLYGWDVYHSNTNGSGDTVQTDYYIQKSETASAEMIVDIAAELIGTPYEGMTCTALLDAGFVEPCQIPPYELPEVEDAPNPSLTECRQGYQETYASNPTISPAGKVADCATRVMAAKIAAYPSLPNVRLGRTTCTGSSTKTMKIYARWGTYETSTELAGTARWTDSTVPCFNLYVADPVSTHVQGPLDPYDPPTGEEPEPVISDATDQEIFDAIKPAISENYFINHTTGQITYLSSSSTDYEQIPITVKTNWGAAPGGTTSSLTAPAEHTVAPVYVSSPFSWPSSPEPTPTPSPSPDPDPSPAPGGSGFDCEANPNSVACANSSVFIDNLSSAISDSLESELDMPDGQASADEVTALFTDALQGVGEEGGDFSFSTDIFGSGLALAGVLPAASDCQVFTYELLPQYGMELDLDTCALMPARVLVEWFLYGLTLLVLWRIAMGNREEI
jgi:hypothetical protein